MQVLSCKQGCVTELASQPGQEKPLEDFLPSHFNYLQFAYYNSKQLLTSYSGVVSTGHSALHGLKLWILRVVWVGKGPSNIISSVQLKMKGCLALVTQISQIFIQLSL